MVNNWEQVNDYPGVTENICHGFCNVSNLPAGKQPSKVALTLQLRLFLARTPPSSRLGVEKQRGRSFSEWTLVFAGFV